MLLEQGKLYINSRPMLIEKRVIIRGIGQQLSPIGFENDKISSFRDMFAQPLPYNPSSPRLILSRLISPCVDWRRFPRWCSAAQLNHVSEYEFFVTRDPNRRKPLVESWAVTKTVSQATNRPAGDCAHDEGGGRHGRD